PGQEHLSLFIPPVKTKPHEIPRLVQDGKGGNVICGDRCRAAGADICWRIAARGDASFCQGDHWYVECRNCNGQSCARTTAIRGTGDTGARCRYGRRDNGTRGKGWAQLTRRTPAPTTAAACAASGAGSR